MSYNARRPGDRLHLLHKGPLIKGPTGCLWFMASWFYKKINNTRICLFSYIVFASQSHPNRQRFIIGLALLSFCLAAWPNSKAQFEYLVISIIVSLCCTQNPNGWTLTAVGGLGERAGVGRHRKTLTKTLAWEPISINLFHLANPTMSQLHAQQAYMRSNFLKVYLQSTICEHVLQKT